MLPKKFTIKITHIEQKNFGDEEAAGHSCR